MRSQYQVVVGELVDGRLGPERTDKILGDLLGEQAQLDLVVLGLPAQQVTCVVGVDAASRS
jgi:hypothetical protein